MIACDHQLLQHGASGCLAIVDGKRLRKRLNGCARVAKPLQSHETESRENHREAVWRGLLVEPPSDETVKLAGVALGKVGNATPIDAIVAAFVAQRTGIVYTSDVDDFHALRRFFPTLQVFAI